MEFDTGILGICMTVLGLAGILLYVHILEKRHNRKRKAIEEKMKNEDK